MQPGWIVSIVIAILFVATTVVLLVTRTSATTDTPTPTMRYITVKSVVRSDNDVYVVDDRVTHEPPNALEYELVSASNMPPLEELPDEPSIEPPPKSIHRRASVYRRRDPTGWYAQVQRFRMKFHSMYMKQRDTNGKKAITFGVQGLPVVEETEVYEYDSLNAELIVPDIKNESVGFDGEVDLACTARYLEFEFEIHSNIHRIRLNISYDGLYGDITLHNPTTDTFEFYDADSGIFTLTRPENTVTMAPGDGFEDIKMMSKDYAVPIPINLLKPVEWERIKEGKYVNIELVPDTCVMFTREPPEGYAREWIMQHVCCRALTGSISAFVEII